MSAHTCTVHEPCYATLRLSLLIRKKQKNVVRTKYFAWFDFATMLTLHLIYPCPKQHADFLIRGFCFVISALGNVPLR